MTYKLIIAGSRTISDYSTIRQAVIDSGLWKLYGSSLEIVSGCAKGADRLGETFATNNGLIIHPFPADWDKLGKRAGHATNCEMAHFADGLVVVIENNSRGSEHMKKYMESLVKFVYTVRV